MVMAEEAMAMADCGGAFPPARAYASPCALRVHFLLLAGAFPSARADACPCALRVHFLLLFQVVDWVLGEVLDGVLGEVLAPACLPSGRGNQLSCAWISQFLQGFL